MSIEWGSMGVGGNQWELEEISTFTAFAIPFGGGGYLLRGFSGVVVISPRDRSEVVERRANILACEAIVIGR